jgi:hypothetical protein
MKNLTLIQILMMKVLKEKPRTSLPAMTNMAHSPLETYGEGRIQMRILQAKEYVDEVKLPGSHPSGRKPMGFYLTALGEDTLEQFEELWNLLTKQGNGDGS